MELLEHEPAFPEGSEQEAILRALIFQPEGQLPK
jgi:hypothetical protein